MQTNLLNFVWHNAYGLYASADEKHGAKFVAATVITLGISMHGRHNSTDSARFNKKAKERWRNSIIYIGYWQRLVERVDSSPVHNLATMPLDMTRSIYNLFNLCVAVLYLMPMSGFGMCSIVLTKQNSCLRTFNVWFNVHYWGYQQNNMTLTIILLWQQLIQ